MSANEATVENVIEQLRSLDQTPSSRHEALCLVMYATLIKEGFRCVGLSETEQEADIETNTMPEGWNRSRDAYSFRFRHHQVQDLFIIKCVTLGNSILVHALAEPGARSLPPLEIFLDEYLGSNVEWSIDNIQNRYFKNRQSLEQFINAVKIQISKQLVPQATDTRVYEEGGDRLPSQQQRPRDLDPLREDGGRFPTQPEHYTPSTPYGVGTEDLYPAGFAPRRPPGGTQVGPDHPMFGGVRDPYGGTRGPGMGGPRLPPGAVPPGARFDPFGPPPMYPRGGGPGPRRFGGDPDPDHFPPPGGDGGGDQPDIPGWYM